MNTPKHMHTVRPICKDMCAAVQRDVRDLLQRVVVAESRRDAGVARVYVGLQARWPCLLWRRRTWRQLGGEGAWSCGGATCWGPEPGPRSCGATPLPAQVSRTPTAPRRGLKICEGGLALVHSQKCGNTFSPEKHPNYAR